MNITVQITDGTHVARCAFAATSRGSPMESAQAFLKGLKRGCMDSPAQKISKSGNESDSPLPWQPLDCGEIDLGDDFRPFVGKRLRRVDSGSPAHWKYEVVS